MSGSTSRGVALPWHGGAHLARVRPPERADDLTDLLAGIGPLLPRRFYAHLTPGMKTVLAGQFRAEPGTAHLKMLLTDSDRRTKVEPLGERLTSADLPELTAFYAAAYPGNYFEPRMLQVGQYVGVRQDGELLAVAGVHVWSSTYRVGALGNIATHPRARGRGLGAAAVARVCRWLLPTVDHIALNVKADNAPAVALYRRLGFTADAEYAETTFAARPIATR